MSDQGMSDREVSDPATSEGPFVPVKQIVEAALLVSPEPLTIDRLQALFGDGSLGDAPPTQQHLQAVLIALADDCRERGYELVTVASGWRFQVRQSLAPWIARMYTERPARYSRALLETLALVAYRQPVTRGDIEEVRGVAVSTGIMRTLLERNWIRVVAHREVPGRPALYGTTKEFLDYFNLTHLDDLPALGEVRDLDEMGRELEMSLGLDLGGAEHALTDTDTDTDTGASDHALRRGAEAQDEDGGEQAASDAGSGTGGDVNASTPAPRSASIVTLTPRDRREG